jgi:hypothetical protein
MKCCIAGCRRRGRTVAEIGGLAFCARCWAYVGATFEWLRRLDGLGHLTFGSNDAVQSPAGRATKGE